jgi:hypothetical protein
VKTIVEDYRAGKDVNLSDDEIWVSVDRYNSDSIDSAQSCCLVNYTGRQRAI